MPTRLILALAMLCVLAGIPLYGNQKTTSAQSGNVIGAGEKAVCRNFYDQPDAQVVREASIETDGVDVYRLDRSTDVDALACNGSRELGDGPDYVTCRNLVDQRHAQALYDSAGGDRYDLAAVNGVACASSISNTSTPTPTPTAGGSTLGSRTCTADRPQIKTSLHDVCAGSHATVIQPGYATISVTTTGSITITPLTSATGATLGSRTAGNAVTTQQEAGSKDRKRERKKLRKQRQRDRQAARDALVGGFRR